MRLTRHEILSGEGYTSVCCQCLVACSCRTEIPASYWLGKGAREKGPFQLLEVSQNLLNLKAKSLTNSILYDPHI